MDKIRGRKNTKSVRCEIIAFLGHAWFNTALQLDFFYSSLLRECAGHGVQFILFSVPWRFFLPYLKTLLFRAFVRGTQREYSSKPIKHSIVERILVFKR